MRAPRTTLLCALIVAACAGGSHAAMSGRKPSAGSGQKALLGGPVGGRPTSLTLLEAQSDDALNDPASKPAPRLTAGGHGEVKHGSAVNDAAGAAAGRKGHGSSHDRNISGAHAHGGIHGHGHNTSGAHAHGGIHAGDSAFLLMFSVMILCAAFSFVWTSFFRRTCCCLPFQIPIGLCFVAVGVAAGTLAHRMDDFDTAHDHETFIHSVATAAKSTFVAQLLHYIFLPILIYKQAFALGWHYLRSELIKVTTLAIPGFIVSVFIMSPVFMSFGHYNFFWSKALILATLLSIRDPSAIETTMERENLKKPLNVLVFGEALACDAVGMTFIRLIVEVGVQQQAWSLGEYIGFTTWMIVGGPIVGYVCAKITLYWIYLSGDEVTEAITSMSMLWLMHFVTASYLQTSAVIAVLVYAVTISVNRTAYTPQALSFLNMFWKLMDFIASSIGYVLIGLIFALNANSFTWIDARYILLTYFLCLGARFVVLVLAYPSTRYTGGEVKFKENVVMWFAGSVHGFATVMTILLIQLDPVLGSSKVWAEVDSLQVSRIAIGVVVLTNILNGSLIAVLLRCLGFDQRSKARLEFLKRTTFQLHSRMHFQQTKLKRDPFMTNANWQLVKELADIPSIHLPGVNPRRSEQEELAKLKKLEAERHAATSVHVDTTHHEDTAEARRAIRLCEINSLWKRHEQGLISDSAFLDAERDMMVEVEQEKRKLDERLLFETMGIQSDEDTDRKGGGDEHEKRDCLTMMSGVPCVGRLFRPWLNARTAERMLLVHALMTGIDDASESIEKLGKFTFGHHVDMNTLLAEQKRASVEAHKELIRLRHAHPNVFCTAATKSAVHAMLIKMLHNVEQFEHEGLLSELEAEQMISMVHARLIHMKTFQSVPALTENQVLEGLPWLPSANSRAEKSLVERGKLLAYLHKVKTVAIKDGDHIFRQNDENDGSLCVIMRGQTLITIGVEEDELVGGNTVKKVLQARGPGSILGVASYFTKHPRSANVEASGNVEYKRLTEVDMLNLLEIGVSRLSLCLWRETARSLSTPMLFGMYSMGKGFEEFAESVAEEWEMFELESGVGMVAAAEGAEGGKSAAVWTIEPPVVLISGEVRGKPNDPDTGEDNTFKALAPDGQVDSRRQSLGMAVLGDDGGDKAARATAAWSGGKPELITSCKQLEVLSGQARIFAKRKTVKPAGLTGQKKKGWSLMQHKTKRALMMGRKMSFSGR